MAYLLSAIIGFSVMIGGGSFLIVKNLLYQQINDHLNMDLQQTSLALQHTLTDANSNLQQLANHPMLANALTDSIGRDTYLKPFFLEHPLAKQTHGALLLGDFNGHSLLTTDTALENWVANSPLVKKVIATSQANAELTAEHQLVIAYPVIFPPTGSTEGIVVYRLNLLALLADEDEKLNSLIKIDVNNQSVSNVPDTLTNILETSKQLVLPTPLDHLDFIVTVMQFKQPLQKPLYKMIQAYLVAALLLSILAVWLAKHLSRNLLKNLNALITEVDAISNSADIPKHPNLLERDTETVRLALAFDRLVTRLHQSYSNLEDKVTERTADLAAAQAAAEAASKAKSNFLANMSHEIRTPMNAIIGFTELAQDTQLNSKQRDYLSKVQQASKSLLGIINDILDFSKIEAGKVDIELNPFSLEELRHDIADQFTTQAQSKGIALSLEISPPSPNKVIGDVMRIRQVLNNLINNAIKFTQHGEINTKIEVVEHEDNRYLLSVTVRDTGIGMSNQEMERLFQAFTQADNTISRRFGGTGLGLAISRQLVELMGGQISVTSQPGIGSTFTFTVPVTTASATTILTPLSTLSQASPTLSLYELAKPIHDCTILLVEDNALNQMIIREFLQKAGLRLVVAEQGAQAVDWVQRAHFDAILMDLQMPVMDGFEATRRIRTLPEGKQVPIIAMTAAAMQHDREACLAVGMNDHLSKPLNARQLIAALLRSIRPEVIPKKASILNQGLTTRPVSVDELIIVTPTGFNFTNILAMLGDNIQQFLQVLTMFTDDYATIAQRITTSIAAGDWIGAEQQVHQIKGVAGNIGAVQLHQISQTLDEQLKQQRCDPELLEKWRTCVAYTLQAISAIVAQQSRAEASETKDPVKFAQLADYLDDLLAQHDFISSDLLAEFKATIDLQPEDYNDLVKSIKKLDYANARLILARIVQPQ